MTVIDTKPDDAPGLKKPTEPAFETGLIVRGDGASVLSDRDGRLWRINADDGTAHPVEFLDKTFLGR